MGVFQLGSLTVVMSDQLVSGFSTGASFHVAVSQLKDLFGIQIGRYSGILKVIYVSIFEFFFIVCRYRWGNTFLKCIVLLQEFY